ncbi:MAG: energy-coupling factor transporter ATPase [Bacilli bacterium]|nr:energy-coupling factor transporter ATPase [Bacilli bacterium]
MNAIEIRNLNFSYTSDKKILKNLSLDIKRGSFVSLLGNNGSGKTTLTKLLVGLLSPDSGEISVEGVLLEKKTINEIRKNVVIVFQNPDNQFIGATVEDDIAFGLENRQIPRDEMLKIVSKYASLVDMSDFINREPSSLSGGQKQRVAIAGALALSPKILILDESTAMLDPKGKSEIISLIQDLRKNMPELTIISITHDMEEAALSDRILYLKNGEIVADDSPDNLFLNEKFVEENHIKLPFIYLLKKELNKQLLSSSGNTIEEVIKNVFKN